MLIMFPELIERGEVVLYDPLGRQVYARSIPAPTDRMEIPIDAYATGAMVAVLRTAQGRWSARVVLGN
jgi:hypothetical protein